MSKISQIEELVQVQLRDPSVQMFLEIIYKLAELDLKYFAKNSDFREAAFLKILQHREYDDDEVKDALETLRLTLLDSIDHPDWVSNYRDAVFCETIRNEGLVYDCVETECDIDSLYDSLMSDSESSSESFEN
jgi:hypothetical protein